MYNIFSPYVNVPPPVPNHYGYAPPARPAPPTDHIKESILSALENKIRMKLRDNLGISYLHLFNLKLL